MIAIIHDDDDNNNNDDYDYLMMTIILSPLSSSLSLSIFARTFDTLLQTKIFLT